jgi:hypothetical protein
MKRPRKRPRRRHVPFYHWCDVEPKGDLWIKGPRKIRLWQNPMAERYPNAEGGETELYRVQ